MKPLLQLLLIAIASVHLHAQSSRIDSLNRLIALAKTDTARINLLVKKVNLYSNHNLDTAIQLGRQVLAEAKKAKYYEGEISIWQGLIVNYCFKGEYASASEGLHYLEKFIRPDDSLKLSSVYANYGMLYGMQSKYDSSARFYEKAIGIQERRHDSTELSNNYSNIAISYQQQANYPMALKYQQQALRIAEARHNEVSQAYTLTNMGITYENYGDTAKAEQTYLKAGELAARLQLSNVELYVYTNLSSLYINEQRWQKGYDYAMKAVDVGNKFGDKGTQAASLSKAAVAKAHQRQFEEALVLGKRAVLLADSSGQPLNISQAYAAMGSILQMQEKYKEAIPFYERNFEALKGRDIYVQGNGVIYKELSDCYEKTGDYIKALASYRKSADIGDSVKNKDNIRKATEMSMNFEFEKKQEVQAAEKKKQDEISRAKQLALLIGLLAAFALAGVAFYGYSNKQKANALLVQQKQKIESTLDELKATQKQLIQSEKMASLGELTAGIAHEIQNPLNFVNNFAEVNAELVAEMTEAIKSNDSADILAIAGDIGQNSEKILHHGKRADAIVKGMLQHSRISSEQKEVTDINTLVEEYLRLSYHGMRAKDKSFNVKLDTSYDSALPKLKIVPQDVGRVLLNMLGNSFYAVHEKKKQLDGAYDPQVQIATSLQDGQVKIKISDNGTGIPPSVADKIFQPFFTTKPTGQGTGLGLSLSYDIIKAHNGTIHLDNREKEGAAFTVSLPVNG